MDAKKTIEKLRGEADRARFSVYFSQSLFSEFKEACGEISPSRVLEELMREFVDSSSKAGFKARKKNKKN